MPHLVTAHEDDFDFDVGRTVYRRVNRINQLQDFRAGGIRYAYKNRRHIGYSCRKRD